jgi:hypothetical protein
MVHSNFLKFGSFCYHIYLPNQLKFWSSRWSALWVRKNWGPFPFQIYCVLWSNKNISKVSTYGSNLQMANEKPIFSVLSRQSDCEYKRRSLNPDSLVLHLCLVWLDPSAVRNQQVEQVGTAQSDTLVNWKVIVKKLKSYFKEGKPKNLSETIFKCQHLRRISDFYQLKKVFNYQGTTLDKCFSWLRRPLFPSFRFDLERRRLRQTQRRSKPRNIKRKNQMKEPD